MKPLFKLILWLASATLLLLLLAAVVVPLYVDPNDFKGPLGRQLEARLGRPVEIQGDIGLSVFPWLGFEVGRVTLGNPPGWKDPTFASVEAADVRVRLLPLVRRQVEMDTVEIRGLDLRLTRDREGRTSWEGLFGPAASAGAKPSGEKEPTATSGPALAALAIGGLDLRDARVAWTDEATGQHFAVDGLRLKTGAILPGQPVPLDVSLRLHSRAPALDGEATLEGQLDLVPERSTYRVRDLALQGRVRGPGMPEGGVDLSARGQVELDLAQQTLKAVPLILSGLGVEGEAAVVLEQLQGELRYSASLDTRETDLRTLIERLGGDPIKTTDPFALTKATLGTRVSGNVKSASVNPLVLRLDGSTLEGKVEIPSLAGPAVRFDLQIDRLDLDRYLPPEQAAAATNPAAAGAAAARLPVDLLRRLDLKGQVRVADLTAARVRMRDLALTLVAKDGVVTLDPTEAQLYQGVYNGRSRLEVRGEEPRFSLEQQITRVQAGPLLKDLIGRGRLTGTADLTLRLELAGEDADAMRRSLRGDGRFSVRDGALVGVNIGRMIREAQAVLQGRSPPREDEPAQTDFSELRATFQIANGVARTQDLTAKSPLLRVEGEGSSDLVREQHDYRLKAHVVGTSEGQGGRDLGELKGLAIPVRVTGSFAEPRYTVELDEVLKGQAREEAEQRIDRALEKKLGPDGAEKAKELLKGLFR
jgi:AsmA protein